MRLFDTYIAVDWSSKNTSSPLKPSPDAIWIGEKEANGAGKEIYCRTRHDAETYLREKLLHSVESGRRVLIGFDFAYGYPAGFAKALGADSQLPPWQYIWNELLTMVRDSETNENNRFEVVNALNERCGGNTQGPFWGCHPNKTTDYFLSTSPQYPYKTSNNIELAMLRHIDKQQKGVQSVWKMYGNGSVGGQSIVGIPVVGRLRYDPKLASISRIWPFETGFKLPSPMPRPFILHVEIWPGVIDFSSEGEGLIRDQAQVRAMVNWFERLDATEKLAQYFSPPATLSQAALEVCMAEEGWILGVGHQIE